MIQGEEELDSNRLFGLKIDIVPYPTQFDPKYINYKYIFFLIYELSFKKRNI